MLCGAENVMTFYILFQVNITVTWFWFLRGKATYYMYKLHEQLQIDKMF
jgi:hypothetical protein